MIRPRCWVLLLALLGVSCGKQDSAPRDRLVVYSAGPRGLAEQVVSTFTEETGIEVDLFQATTGQLMARLEAERYRPRADVVLFASEVAAAALKLEERLRAFTPREADALHPDWSDPDGYYYATAAALVGIAVPSHMEEEWSTWAEVLREAGGRGWTMPSPSRSGAAGDFVVTYFITRPDAMDTFRTARSGGLEFAAANSQAIGGLLMGAYTGIAGAVDYLIYRQIERGEAVRMAYPAEGGILVTRPIGILTGARNPEGAEAFVNFYFSREAQRMVAGAHLLPGRRDVPLSDIRGTELPRLIRADPAEAVARQSAILRDFQIRVERAVLPGGER